MKRCLKLLILTWLGLLGMVTMVQALEVTKFPISTIRNNKETSPAIYGDIVVWQAEGSNNSTNIYGKNLATGDNFDVSIQSNDQINPSISGDLVVWEQKIGSTWSVYGKYLSGGNEFIISRGNSTDSDDYASPQVSGNIVVWQDYRNGNSDIYGKDLSGELHDGEAFEIATGTSLKQHRPKIYNDIVVWESYNDSTKISSVYGKNLATDDFYFIAIGTEDINCVTPDIYGTRVAWVDKAPGSDCLYTKDLINNDLHFYHNQGKPTYPDLSENLIVWKQQGTHGNIFAKDINHPEDAYTLVASQNDFDYNDTFGPATFDNTVVWSYYYYLNYDADIYGATVVPLPATFWLLGAGLGMLAVGRRFRR